MTTNDRVSDLTKMLATFTNKACYRLSTYKGYTLIYQPLIGDCHIFDTHTGELVEVTGMGTSGAKIYIDQWNNAR